MLPEPPKKHPGGGIEESEEAAVNETAEGEPKYGGTLRFGYGTSIATPGYTPMATANAYLYYLTLAYENLITYDNDGQIIGKLATEWVIDNDEPSITWTLREGVEFADGTPFNAEAVKVNIEEYQANSRTETANVKSCEVIDDTHIKMILESVNSSTLESVGYFVFYMSPDVLKNDRASLDTSTCGTGPFQLTEFENNAYAIYSKNENYWQEGLPYLDCAYEVASAMGTAGLTCGLTPGLSRISQGLIIALMYLGRVGILSFSIAFITRNHTPAKLRYPEMRVMIG